MKNKYLYLTMLTMLFSCADEKETGQKYLRWIGDIEHDSEIDGSDFKLCNGDKNVKQYFNLNNGLQFEGEKLKIVNHFKASYQPVDEQQSGWIRIRFIVNCKGETGRFRVIESDENYMERPFDDRISGQLLQLTKSLKGWKVLPFESNPVDYYQYLIFKINDGKIEKVMP